MFAIKAWKRKGGSFENRRHKFLETYQDNTPFFVQTVMNIQINKILFVHFMENIQMLEITIIDTLLDKRKYFTNKYMAARYLVEKGVTFKQINLFISECIKTNKRENELCFEDVKIYIK